MDIYIEHANITVKSITESGRLLQAAFPAFRIRGEGDSLDKHWVHIGDDVTYLTLNEPLEKSGTLLEKDYTLSGLNHVAFVVDDLDAVNQRLQAAGYANDEKFQEESSTRRRHYYVDGNGLEWEFVQYLTDDLGERNRYL